MASKSVVPPLFKIGRIELHTKPKKLQKLLKEAGKPHDLSDYSGCCIYSLLESHGVLYVYIGDGKVTTLVHELFHATIRYLGYVGVPVETDASNETYAYLLEHLVEEFLPLLAD